MAVFGAGCFFDCKGQKCEKPVLALRQVLFEMQNSNNFNCLVKVHNEYPNISFAISHIPIIFSSNIPYPYNFFPSNIPYP